MRARPPVSILVVAGLGLLVFFGASLALARPTHLIVRVVDTAGPMSEWETWREHRDLGHERQSFSRSTTGPEPCSLPPDVDVTGRSASGSEDRLYLSGPSFGLGCGFGVDGWFELASFDGTRGLECRVAKVGAREIDLVPRSSEHWFDPPSVRARRGDVVTFRATRYPPETRVRLRVHGAGVELSPARWSFQPMTYDERISVAPSMTPDADGRLPRAFDDTSELRGWIVSTGLRSQWVTGSILEYEAGELCGDVALEPGFRARLHLVDAEGEDVGAGVQVAFGDATIETNSSGTLTLEDDDPHPELRVRVHGHRICGGDVAPDGTLPPGRAALIAVVEPVTSDAAAR